MMVSLHGYLYLVEIFTSYVVCGGVNYLMMVTVFTAKAAETDVTVIVMVMIVNRHWYLYGHWDWTLVNNWN